MFTARPTQSGPLTHFPGAKTIPDIGETRHILAKDKRGKALLCSCFARFLHELRITKTL